MAEDHSETPAPSRIVALVEVAAAVLLVLAGGAMALFMPKLIGSGGIETARDFLTLSPAFFPRLAMGLMAVVCIPYAVSAVRDLAQADRSRDAQDLARVRRAGIMIIVAVCYALFMSWLGFILATMLAALVVSYFLELRNPLHYLPAVFVAPVAIRFVFERLLYIALPRSEIEFIAAIEDAIIKFLVAVLL